MRGQFIVHPEDSRYGQIQFIMKEDSFLVVQEDGVETRMSNNPLMDAKKLFEDQIKNKDKPRVYCNKTLAGLIPKSYNFFGTTDRMMFFHNRPEYLVTHGMISRSGKTCELRFNMPHGLMKSKRIRRIVLNSFYDVGNRVTFEIETREDVTWKNRNKRFDKPVITIG
ncbi:hypothetical protein PP939_gp109 [Rhizobium phage RL38J1]|uniref:Uncharacterized protein n=2 Tax=Innesvirus TaxID=3044739 RepID=A0A6B9J1G1_9CAUD|nr:hypothetical protein PP939_gp109 [Rhizobium phage RL38J1]YP_010662874.1 hypothetical protein PP940_gp196 [Rhizobium phage RL2RES]QGZ13920.1 hypothetical protein RL38J1_109 [Rhizobium phage RL38J1]QGZ14189.1 hypothetical protein RL2RES_196 [Rhizobium phage RL2RES]